MSRIKNADLDAAIGKLAHSRALARRIFEETAPIVREYFPAEECVFEWDGCTERTKAMWTAVAIWFEQDATLIPQPSPSAPSASPREKTESTPVPRGTNPATP